MQSATGTCFLEQTFSMVGLNPATATLSGLFAADNCAEIWLNTTLLATTNAGSACSTSHPTAHFNFITNFIVPSSAFIAGTNILQVRLRNDGGPTGVIVEFQQHTADEVPEPAVSALIGIGLAAIALRRKLA